MAEVGAGADPGTQTPHATQVKRETVQMTLSAIGDVGVASSEAISGIGEASRVKIWRPTVIFFLAVYVTSVVVVALTFRASPWIRLLVTPLFAVFCATAVFWRRQVWKARAEELRFKLKVWQEALNGLGHEAINVANAIRANLMSFRALNLAARGMEHLEVIEEGTHRIERAVRKAEDPIQWKGFKKRTRDASCTYTT